jgi:hypothetical protein
VSTATTTPTATDTATAESPTAAGASVPRTESCPLCAGPLRADQEWCLSCGAAARTRLAATPNWRAPLIALGVVIVLALATLTVALVSLAGQ